MSARMACVLLALSLAFSPALGDSSNQQSSKTAPNSAPEKTQTSKDKILLQSKLVSLTLTVSDSQGRFVTGLAKDRFEVYDDNVRQEIALFSSDDAPISLGIVYDVSGSMTDLTTQSFIRLKEFFNTSHADDEFFIVAFNSRPHLVQDFTVSPTDIMDRVIFVKAEGNTALYDAVYLALEKVKQGRHPRKALLIISDGIENNSRYTMKELGERLKEADALVYAVGTSAFSGHALKQIVELSGGHAFFPEDNQVGDVYTRIAVMLRHQYVIGFYPTDSEAASKWHQVQIKLNAPKGLGRLSLSYKKGYQSFNR